MKWIGVLILAVGFLVSCIERTEADLIPVKLAISGGQTANSPELPIFIRVDPLPEVNLFLNPCDTAEVASQTWHFEWRSTTLIDIDVSFSFTLTWLINSVSVDQTISGTARALPPTSGGGLPDLRPQTQLTIPEPAKVWASGGIHWCVFPPNPPPILPDETRVDTSRIFYLGTPEPSSASLALIATVLVFAWNINQNRE